MRISVWSICTGCIPKSATTPACVALRQRTQRQPRAPCRTYRSVLLADEWPSPERVAVAVELTLVGGAVALVRPAPTWSVQ